LDGSDCIETVSLIIELSRQGVVPKYFSLHEEIDESFNYLTKQVDPTEERYMHKESARISRDKVLSIDQCRADQFDMLLIPGGGGIVRNLSNFEQEEYNIKEAKVNSDVEKVIRDFHGKKKPIGLMSNSIILAAQALGSKSGKTSAGVGLALGKALDRTFVETVQTKLGNELSDETSDADQILLDSTHRVASVSGVAASSNVLPNEIYNAAKNLVSEVIQLSNKKDE